MTADGQHDVACVKDIIAPILGGQADFVIGSRFVKKEQDNFKSTLMRRVGIRIISFAIRLVTAKRSMIRPQAFVPAAKRS